MIQKNNILKYKIFVLPSKELPSEIFYYYLKISNEELKEFYDICKTLDSPYNKDMKIIRYCAKLMKYLKHYYEKINRGKLKKHHCNLLSHWLYEELNEKFNYNFKDLISIYGGFKRILSIVLKDSNEPQAINCLREVTVLAFNNWKDRKDLYDYCVDYDKIKELANSSYENCKKYKEYIKGKSKLYDNFEKLYISEYKKENNDFYKKCESCNPNKVIHELDCEAILLAQEKKNVDSHGPDLLGSTQSSGKNSDSTNTYGNVLLGVVVTSMTSGMLYKVNKILIKTYQQYKLFDNLFAIRINNK
ncbi:hypothetical protein PVBG_05710 [Plasmodium vivax Brazil I]|uniref:Variable surface protein n=1 Tax=Plasmodium vivax (strain Brazil I) TaxID=1033975 RepID=A0A0J9VNN5_PLAV1|nr:hypothetical protein PVBG_05710 [Plasmodium vivax Brazil I]